MKPKSLKIGKRSLLQIKRSEIRKNLSEDSEGPSPQDDYSSSDDAYNPLLTFPFSNKLHEAKEKTMAEESKQWESFFDPQYTFGSFQHGIRIPSQQPFYKGKWPLEHKDILGMTTDETFLFPTVPSPTLPNLDFFDLQTNQEMDRDTSIEILPCPSLTFPKHIENEGVWKERLELLKMIQNDVFHEKLNGTEMHVKESTKARFQRQIRNRAEKIKYETLLESDNEEEDPPVAISIPSLDLDDNWEKLTFSKPEIEDQSIKKKNRPSFLLFAYGFLFPPLWIVGAFYKPSLQRTSASKQIDMKWKKYSRNAILVFILVLVITIFLVLVCKPETVGFRNGPQEGYQNEEKIIFDENKVII